MSDEQDAAARPATDAGDGSAVRSDEAEVDVVEGAVVEGAVVESAVAGNVVEGVVEDGVVERHEPTEAPGPTRLRMRRAPRYRAFGGTGVAIGVAVGVILALSFKADSNYSIQTITGYFAASFALFGGVLGLGLAVLLERRRS